MEKINHNRQYLYCSVDLDLSLISDLYSSSNECFDDYKQEIVTDCQCREYNEDETTAVLNHYQCKIEMWGGKWGQVRPHPEIEKDQLVYVKLIGDNEWYMRYFSHFDKDGRLCFFGGQYKSDKATISRKADEYSLKNPLI